MLFSCRQPVRQGGGVRGELFGALIWMCEVFSGSLMVSHQDSLDLDNLSVWFSVWESRKQSNFLWHRKNPSFILSCCDRRRFRGYSGVLYSTLLIGRTDQPSLLELSTRVRLSRPASPGLSVVVGVRQVDAVCQPALPIPRVAAVFLLVSSTSVCSVRGFFLLEIKRAFLSSLCSSLIKPVLFGRTPLPGCARVWQTRIFFSVCLKGSRTDSAQVNFKAEEWRVDALFTSASSRLLQVAGISVMVVLHTLQLDRGNVSDDFSIFHILATTTLTMAVGGSTGVRYYMYFIVLCGGSTGVRYYMYFIVLCGGSTGVRYYMYFIVLCGGSTGVRYYIYFIVLCGGSTGVRYDMYFIAVCGGSTGVREKRIVLENQQFKREEIRKKRSSGPSQYPAISSSSPPTLWSRSPETLALVTSVGPLHQSERTSSTLFSPDRVRHGQTGHSLDWPVLITCEILDSREPLTTTDH
ncbi:hypothetical protein RRG08_020424 [Elysia crispata]|uniref:Uncharacterized protein n=1 Tax=Elysia crispata TaxID=231223 RepID=A0AAE1B4G2_9GAST|nr:hypothetical protein RRG08_020424 [Elysia crispata]